MKQIVMYGFQYNVKYIKRYIMYVVCVCIWKHKKDRPKQFSTRPRHLFISLSTTMRTNQFSKCNVAQTQIHTTYMNITRTTIVYLLLKFRWLHFSDVTNIPFSILFSASSYFQLLV